MTKSKPKEEIRGRRFKDMTGVKVGRLTVLKIDHQKYNRYFWECKCECGNKAICDGASLRLKNSTSCGCSRKYINKEESNGMWKGDNVGYTAIHGWLKRHKVKSNKCDKCGKITSHLDAANISQEYKRDIADWEWLCRSCHMLKDGRMNNLKYVFLKKCKTCGELLNKEDELDLKLDGECSDCFWRDGFSSPADRNRKFVK